jgi:hypothetical protein
MQLLVRFRLKSPAYDLRHIPILLRIKVAKLLAFVGWKINLRGRGFRELICSV